MIDKITKGIKISVETNYEGIHVNEQNKLFAFSYVITIENQSSDVVQLLSRKWEIHDSLFSTETVIGDGVVGQIPILEPNERYRYTSHCLLKSTVGSMRGHYRMVNFSTKEEFNVEIPTFQLVVKGVLN
ncbi:MAG: Co2+/Mg2+ efflux protein ApaG [Flavicella sp.]